MTDLSPKDSSPRDTFDLTMVIQLITRIKEVWFSKRGIYSMLICVLLGISIGGGIAWFDEPKYLAITTFLTEEKSGGAGLSGMMALASQFGIGAAGKDETQKLLELLKSRVIFEKACMDTVEIEGVRDLIINHYLKKLTYRNKVILSSSLKANFSCVGERRDDNDIFSITPVDVWLQRASCSAAENL